ncbi:IS3 family transposase [Tessaracoccus rhinocerotis]|uniref:IS3 family transposase n=1 Tax=Tessaracoccus rhinocerotis TaxID=1689449 RepID=A0A553JVS2_9ACTN|nr:IS3 family transposase [Tessaracoccus rhinocerotis]
MQIAPSTYYANKHHTPSARTIRDAELVKEIRTVHSRNLGVYGARKVHAELQRQGQHVARCTVERLMRAEGLRGITRAKTLLSTALEFWSVPAGWFPVTVAMRTMLKGVLACRLVGFTRGRDAGPSHWRGNGSWSCWHRGGRCRRPPGRWECRALLRVLGRTAPRSG